MRSDLPSGTVTFLFTDVEGSTRLLHELGAEGYAEALAEHRRLVREACVRYQGVEVDTQGDAFFFAFPTAPGALSAAGEMTEALGSGPIHVRVGLHTGTPLVTDEGYVGTDMHRAARIAGVGHGGQVLVSTSTASLVDRDLLRDLGEHRLKDLSALERIYQLGDCDFPPLTSLHHTNLPVPTTPFLGREKELAEVGDLLSRSDIRLLTLTGPGGTGKTRLAAQAAGMAAGEHPDGVWWVPLDTLRDPTFVLESAAQVLGAKRELGAHIGDRRMLILFDCFERVLDGAAGLAGLQSACPNLKLLVTSRERLHLTGEQEYAVPPFTHEEAVGFFSARARAAKHDFETDATVPEICRRLDDIPLALELAAARVKVLSTRQILERGLPLSTPGPRDLPDRQRTLRATIEWSYELLSGEEQRLFARLAVFAGGCTLEAAEEVAGAHLDTLQSLVEKSLLRFSSERFWMLETIRGYAAERLDESGALESLRGRHASYFTTAAEAKHAEWMYGDEVRSPYRWFRTEQANLRDAVEWAAVDLELQLRLLHAARRHGTFGGRERRRLLESALARLGDERSLRHARALANAAEAAMDMDDREGALGYHERALALYRSLGDGEGTARSLVGRGWDLWELGRAVEARTSFEAALATAKREKATPVIRGASSSLARISLIEGDFNAALRFAAQAQEVADSEDGYSSRVVGLVELSRGNVVEAVRILSDLLASQYELGYEPSLPATLDALAAALLATGSVERAVVLMGQSGALRDVMGFEPDSFFRGLGAEVARVGQRQLGEDAYRAAVVRGEAMSTDEAVEYALASLD